MVQRTRCKALTIISSLVMLLPLTVGAQHFDKEKYWQIRSMECGDWWFGPGEYYYVNHKNYSGAEWHWRLGVPPWTVRYKEEKSNVQGVGKVRAEQIPFEAASSKFAQDQNEEIDPLYQEELLLTAERSVDLIYSQYKSMFNELGESIKQSLLYAKEHAKGNLDKTLEELQDEYDVICASIEYAHKAGLVPYQIEPTKRQLLYEDAKTKLTDLNKACFDIARLASTY